VEFSGPSCTSWVEEEIMAKTRRKARGIALIVVLGVLSLLALLAVSFSTLAATERATSRNYLDTVRARLVAQSGIEAGIARLLERGVLMNETEWAPAMAPIRVNGVEVRPAGLMDSASYVRRGDFYTLRITDSNAQINVNDGLAAGPSHAVSRNLRRILNVLGA